MQSGTYPANLQACLEYLVRQSEEFKCYLADNTPAHQHLSRADAVVATIAMLQEDLSVN